MAKRRMKRYSRRTRAAGKTSRVPVVVLCVVIFLILSVSISVVIGILLGKRADEVSSRPKFEFEKVQYQSGGKTVSSIEGYHFAKGASAADYYAQGIRDFSFCLRYSDGTLAYSSTVAESLMIDATDSDASLTRAVSRIKDEGGRACGYFYVTAFEEQNEGLRDVYLAYELSLIAEMAESGIDEILLLGIDVSDENIDSAAEFLARASLSAKNTAIGVALSLDTLRATENEVYFAARMKNACDFLALDLCHLTLSDAEDVIDKEGDTVKSTLETLIVQNEYYIRTYKLRLLFSKDHSQIYRSATELGVVDFQIVGR